MGKADHQLSGYEIFWYSNDHAPPHLHIEKKGHWGIKIKFTLSDEKHLNFETVWQNQTRAPSSKEQKLFLQIYTKIPSTLAARMGDQSMQTKMRPQENKDIAILVADKDAYSAIPRVKNIHSFANVNDKNLEDARNIFIITTGMSLPGISNFIKHTNSTKQLRGLLVRQDSFQSWITQLLDMADLRSLHNLLVHSDNKVVRRILTAWNYGAQNKLIADAAVLENKLLVRDCALNRYVLHFDDIRDLSSIQPQDRSNFEISEEGTRISWSDYDIDINLDSIKSALNPIPSKKESAEHDRLLGSAIAKLRKKKRIRQIDIPGLDERHLRKIESGNHRATTRSLQSLADAHNMTLNNYMNELSSYVVKPKSNR